MSEFRLIDYLFLSMFALIALGYMTLVSWMNALSKLLENQSDWLKLNSDVISDLLKDRVKKLEER